MNVYLDSSAVANLFTSRITYAETRAAIAGRERESPERVQEWVEARAHLKADWSAFGVIEVVQPLMECAGDVADALALRGYDAIQLAAAHMAHQTMLHALSFFSYDRRLNRAAKLLGLQLPEDVWL